MSHDHPYIDFDGDGHGDTYQTSDLPDGGHEFTHFDPQGRVDAVAYDHNGDGLVDTMDTDNDHDGVLDHHNTDVNGDGWMDTHTPIEHHDAAPPATHTTGAAHHEPPTYAGAEHPRIDFTGDGRPDPYQTVHLAHGGNAFVHAGPDGKADAIAYDTNNDGRIDAADVDSNRDGVLDERLFDTNEDGWVDREVSLGDTGLGYASS